jgi:hypothetical protein
MADEAEYEVILGSGFVLAAKMYAADQSDPSGRVDRVRKAPAHVVLAGSVREIEEAVAKMGSHMAETLAGTGSVTSRSAVTATGKALRHRGGAKDSHQNLSKIKGVADSKSIAAAAGSIAAGAGLQNP